MYVLADGKGSISAAQLNDVCERWCTVKVEAFKKDPTDSKIQNRSVSIIRHYYLPVLTFVINVLLYFVLLKVVVG